MTAPAPAPVPQLAKKWKVKVSPATGTPTWTEVKGSTSVQLTLDYTQQDQTDYDSGMWSGGQFVTQIAWSVAGTVLRKLYGADSDSEDAGQKIIREAAVPVGDAQPKQIMVQVYDRFGGEEAYQGTVTAQWAPQAGSPTDLESANFTLSGVGERETVTNPEPATP